MHLVADLPQIYAAWAAVHQKRFATAPKQMTPQTVTAIESLGVGAQGLKLSIARGETIWIVDAH
jgi:hypothetical protein